MRERQFIGENKEKWREFESMVDQNGHDPARLGELFTEVTDDLSYARTFYPNRSVRVYLNQLAQQVFHKLYRSRKRRKRWLLSFLLEEIPSSVFYARRELLLSLIIFLFAIGAGILSGIKHPEFARSILGDQYVEMTEQNISEGDPMAVYKDDNQFYVFAYIAFNNLRIDFYTFVSGLFFGIWTILMLIYNGVMVGAFQYFFAERGLFSESFLTIWMHGTLELSAAVIAGGAGLILGRGIVFPGTYSRLQSLMMAARQGLKILMVAVLMTTIAAVIESFLTRYTGMPNSIRMLFIFISFAFVVGYFVVLPWLKHRNGSILPQTEEFLVADINHLIDLDEVKGVGSLFSEGFVIYRRMLKKYLLWIVPVCAIYAIAGVLFNYQALMVDFSFFTGGVTGPFAPMIWTFNNLSAISTSGLDVGILLMNVLLIGCIFTLVFFLLGQVLDAILTLRKRPRISTSIAAGFAFAVFINLAINLDLAWIWIILLTVLPIFLIAITGRIFDGASIRKGLQIYSVSVWSSFGLILSYMLINLILFTLITFPVFSVTFSLADMFFGVSEDLSNRIFIGNYLFFMALAISIIIPPSIAGLTLLYYSGREIVTAQGLRQKLGYLSDNDKISGKQ